MYHTAAPALHHISDEGGRSRAHRSQACFGTHFTDIECCNLRTVNNYRQCLGLKCLRPRLFFSSALSCRVRCEKAGDTDAHNDLYRRAEVAVRAAAAAALERPALALGPKETAEVEMGAAFFGRLAALVSCHSQTLQGL